MSSSRYEKFLLEGEALPAANAVMVPPYESSGEWTGVWAHEYFHFLQFSGTRMGQLLCFQFASLGHFVKAFLKEPPDVLTRTPIWPFPFLLWATHEESGPLADCLRKHFGFLMFMVETIGLYLGILPSLGSSNRWNSTDLWAWVTLPPKDHIYPVVLTSAGTEMGYLTTLSVMETAAALQGLRFEGSDMKPKNEMGSGSWLMGFGLAEKQRNILLGAHRRYNIGLLYVENSTSIPSGLAASAAALAADLALDSGIDELYQVKQSGSVAWEDWYPGWRFIKAVKVIEDLVVNQRRWPQSEDQLSEYIAEIKQRNGWQQPSAQSVPPLSVSPDQRFASDRARLLLAENAKVVRRTHESLWSVSAREQLLQASANWFKPPIVCQYGHPTYGHGRVDLSADDVQELWSDAQYEHIAWQLLGHGNPYRCTYRIECFPWSKEGSGKACEEYNGHCRWFPPSQDRPLPTGCPMLRIITDMCRDNWVKLRPMVVTLE